MKRYRINHELKGVIKNSRYSMRKISQMLGFEVKNIYCRNFSIREDHFKKLSSLLKLNMQLEEVNLDYGRNLGKNSFTQPINLLKESGNSAEFIGIMLGDGNIYKNQVKIALDKFFKD